MSPPLRDVVIVGAGPVGAVLARALADCDLDVVVLDSRPAQGASRAERALALSHGARLILERIGLWGELASQRDAVTAITDIDVSQANGFGTAKLHARDHGLSALGYLVSYRALQHVLDQALQRTQLDLRFDTSVESVGGTRTYAAVNVRGDADPLLARLAIVADGTGMGVDGISRRRHAYSQLALVAKVWTRAPHGGCAFERFSAEGPMALLPEQDHYALVWTAPVERVQTLLSLPDALFLSQLAAAFAPRRTDFVEVRERRSFPLSLEVAPSIVSTRCAVAGNAAQALHPVAAQGLNLGLRDAYELARIIVDTPRDAIGSESMLARYASSRRVDRLAGVAFTHGLLSIFGNASPWLRWPRGVALSALDAVAPAKRAFTRAILFGLH